MDCPLEHHEPAEGGHHRMDCPRRGSSSDGLSSKGVIIGWIVLEGGHHWMVFYFINETY